MFFGAEFEGHDADVDRRVDRAIELQTELKVKHSLGSFSEVEVVCHQSEHESTFRIDIETDRRWVLLVLRRDGGSNDLSVGCSEAHAGK